MSKRNDTRGRTVKNDRRRAARIKHAARRADAARFDKLLSVYEATGVLIAAHADTVRQFHTGTTNVYA